MRLLLDTHVWLWRLVAPDTVSEQVEALISDPRTELFLSPVSLWETLVLARKGRLALSLPPSEWISEALRRSLPTSAPLNNSVAIRSENLEGFGSGDPADRFIVATAIEYDLELATADSHMHAFDQVKTVW